MHLTGPASLPAVPRGGEARVRTRDGLLLPSCSVQAASNLLASRSTLSWGGSCHMSSNCSGVLRRGKRGVRAAPHQPH